MAFSLVKTLQPGPPRLTQGSPIFENPITLQPRAPIPTVSSSGGGNMGTPGILPGSAQSGIAFSPNVVTSTPIVAGSVSGSPILLIALAVLAFILLRKD